MSNTVLSIPQMNWNDCYNSLAMAIYGAIQYSSKRYSLEEVLVYTGQGFIINTDHKVGPMDVFGDGEFLRHGLEGLGFDSTFLAANLYGSEWTVDSNKKALSLIHDSINRGIPAIGWNLDNYEHGLIYGYDDERQILFIHDINARKGGELSYDLLGQRGLNGSPIDPELFVLILQERQVTPHINVTRYTQEQDVSYRATLHNALQLIVKHIEGIELTKGDRRNGIPAIDTWIEAVDSGNAHPFFTTYNLLWITSSRQYVVNFFIRSIITHCMSIQNLSLQRLMMEASEHYLTSFHSWVALRQLFPFPNGSDKNDAVVHSETLRHLRSARQAETSSLEVLKNMLKNLNHQ